MCPLSGLKQVEYPRHRQDLLELEKMAGMGPNPEIAFHVNVQHEINNLLNWTHTEVLNEILTISHFYYNSDWGDVGEDLFGVFLPGSPVDDPDVALGFEA